jgi:hypothetical protein
MAQPDEDFFQFSARWPELRRLATGDPDDEMFTDKLIALLEERDKELEYFLENRVTSTDLATGGISIAPPQVVGFTNQWNNNSINQSTMSTGSINSILGPTFFYPWVAPADMTLTDVSINLVSTTTGSIRLGLYNADGTGNLPSTLVSEFGNDSSLSAGAITFSSLSVAVTGGAMYWWCYQTTSATRTLGIIEPDSAPNAAGSNSATGTSPSQVVSTRTHASGLESTIATGPTIVTTVPTIKFAYKATV